MSGRSEGYNHAPACEVGVTTMHVITVSREPGGGLKTGCATLPGQTACDIGMAGGDVSRARVRRIKTACAQAGVDEGVAVAVGWPEPIPVAPAIFEPVPLDERDRHCAALLTAFGHMAPARGLWLKRRFYGYFMAEGPLDDLAMLIPWLGGVLGIVLAPFNLVRALYAPRWHVRPGGLRIGSAEYAADELIVALFPCGGGWRAAVGQRTSSRVHERWCTRAEVALLLAALQLRPSILDAPRE